MYDAYMQERDLCWLAGLLEGEGCFGVYKNRPGKDGKRKVNATIQLNMNDEDVVRRAFEIVGAGSVGGPYGKDRGDNIKAQGYYKLGISGEPAAKVMRELLDSGLMGERRTKKIISVLAVHGSRMA